MGVTLSRNIESAPELGMSAFYFLHFKNAELKGLLPVVQVKNITMYYVFYIKIKMPFLTVGYRFIAKEMANPIH